MKRAMNILKLCICIGLVAISVGNSFMTIENMFDPEFPLYRKIGLCGLTLVIDGLSLALGYAVYMEYKESANEFRDL